MTTSHGQRSRTRHKFKRPFRRTGAIRMANYLKKYKKGDYVDIIVDGSQHKGMPHHFYHGRTGKIFNVNPRSVGIAIHKQVKQRKIEKRIHVRVEHIRHSNSRLAFVKKILENDKLKAEARKNGQIISTKRQPQGPGEAKNVKYTMENIEAVNVLPFMEIF